MAQMVAFTLGDPGCEQAGLLLSHTPSRGQQAGFWIRERCESHRMPRLASDGCHPELPQSTLGLPGVPGEGMSLPPHPRAPSPPVTSLPPHFCARITPLSPHPCVLRPLPSPHPLTPAAPRGTAPRKERKDAGGRVPAGGRLEGRLDLREVLQGRAASKGPAGTRGEEHTPGLGVAAARWRRGT